MAKLNLGKQIGPLPLGAWIAVVGGGLALGYYANKRMGSGEDEEPEIPVSPETDVGVGGGQFQYEPITTVPSETPTGDNIEWGKKATNYLTSLGYAGTFAQNVVAKFLTAMPLTPAERLLIDQAIVRFGSPPEPIAPVDEGPVTPPPGPGTTVNIPRVTELRVNRARRVNTVVWTYNGPAIGGFLLKITDLKTKHSTTKMVSAKARSYRHAASPAWTKRSAGEQQYYIRAFRGGFTAKKTYGPGATVTSPFIW